jgi:tol-pal system protein YbgF
MKTSFLKYFILCITLTLALPSCTIQLQNELNIQKEHITAIENELMRARKNQANHSSEIDQIKRELQFIKGSIEENSHLTQQNVLELKSKIEALSSSVNQTQGRISSLQKQPVINPKKEPQANPVSNIKSKKDEYDEAYTLYQKEKYSEARKLFKDFSKTYPQDQLTDNEMYWTGMCYSKEKKHEKAITVFEDLINKFPKSNKAPDSHYAQAIAFLELNEPLTAKIILETLIQNFPSSQAASMAKTKQLKLK